MTSAHVDRHCDRSALGGTLEPDRRRERDTALGGGATETRMRSRATFPHRSPTNDRTDYRTQCSAGNSEEHRGLHTDRTIRKIETSTSTQCQDLS